MYKLNTVIPIAYDVKKNKVYMVDVTSRNFYSHSRDFSKVDTSGTTGYLGAMIILGISEWLRPQLYLNDPSRDFKTLLVIAGTSIGFLLFWLVKKKRCESQLEEYLKQHPHSKKIDSIEIEGILNRAQLRAILIIVTIIGFLIASVYMYRQFFNNYNLGTYIWATTLFMISLSTALLLKDARFILKLATEMNTNNQK